MLRDSGPSSLLAHRVSVGRPEITVRTKEATRGHIDLDVGPASVFVPIILVDASARLARRLQIALGPVGGLVGQLAVASLSSESLEYGC